MSNTDQQLELDIESLPTEELRRRATTMEEQPPADEPEKVIDGEPDRVIFTKRIDIGDGAGVQVFEADSLEELVEKLGVAQENATRKIRELAKATPEPAAHKPKEYTPDEEFVISQEMMSNPSKAFKKMFQDMTGQSLEEFSSTQAAMVEFKRQQDNLAAQQQFVSRHPEYATTQANGQRIINFVNKYLGGSMTLENIEKAFSELGGLLDSKSATKAEDTTNEPANAPDTSRIVKPVNELRDEEEPQRKRVASGLSTKGRATVTPTRTHGPTESELYDMPLDKLKELADRELRSSQ